MGSELPVPCHPQQSQTSNWTAWKGRPTVGWAFQPVPAAYEQAEPVRMGHRLTLADCQTLL